MKKMDPLSATIIDREFEGKQEFISKSLTEVIGTAFDVTSAALGTSMGWPVLPPIYSLLIKPIREGYAGWKEIRELEMLVHFLNSSKEISFNQRKKFAKKIDGGDGEFTKKILYSVSILNDLHKAKLLGNLFKALVKELINEDEFLESMNLIEQITINNLRFFYFQILEILKKRGLSLGQLYETPDFFEALYMATANYKFTEDISREMIQIFVSVGLIVEFIEILPMPKIISNVKESKEVARLRKDSSSPVKISYVSRTGGIIIKYGFGLAGS